MMKFLKKPVSLTLLCAILSLFTLVAYHKPFFEVVFDNSEWSFNGVLIRGGLALVMFFLNLFFYYLVLYVGRVVGKAILAILFVGNSITLYFINAYEVLITDKMMGNVFNTQYSEASAYFSFQAMAYVVLLGILPALYVIMQRIDYGSFKRAVATIGSSLGLVLLVVVANMPNFTWIDKNATQIGSLLMPWSYVVNTVRYHNAQRKLNAKEILLPDATISTATKDVCVLVIGESARSDHFSLLGYERQTNPLLAADSVTAIRAKAAATYTTAGVKAILDHKPTSKLYEILPNYLYRAGVDVVWRTSNWGEPPLHIETYQKAAIELKELYPDKNSDYDEILLAGLKDMISNSAKEKLFIVLHTSTSHGPTYYKKYPAAFEQFKPVCTTVEMSNADHAELINAYDNTILYTDYLLHEVIEILKGADDRRACMIYISDHGESLGESGLYMHGVPMSMAPDEQVNIPLIVWHNDEQSRIKQLDEADQYHIFHTALDFLGVESPIFDPAKSLFE